MSNAAVQAAANAANAQTAALNFLAGNVSAQAALAQSPIFTVGGTPFRSPSGIFSPWLGPNGSFPFFAQQFMPQIFLYGDAKTFDLNLTDFPLMPLLLDLDESQGRGNAFQINGLLADASDNPY